MNLKVTQEEKRARFAIDFETGQGNIDENGAEVLKRKFRELDISGLKEVIFDFSEVTHIGSAGIGKLLLFYKDLALNDGRICIENASETVYELFSALKLDTIFSISKAR